MPSSQGPCLKEDLCLYVSRLSVQNVLKNLKAYHDDFDGNNPSLVWIAAEDGQQKYSRDDLTGLSIFLKETLKKNSSRKICIVLDIVPSILMVSSTESVYRFLDQLLAEIRRHDVVLLATFDEGMYNQQVITAMEQLFDGVLQISQNSSGNGTQHSILIKKMRGSVSLQRSVTIEF